MKSMRLFRKREEGVASRGAQGPATGQTRRSWLDRTGLAALALSITGIGSAFVRSLFPNVLYEPAQRFKAGLPEQFSEGATFLEDQRVYVFREQKTFYCISAVCTHLGCTVKMVNLNQPKTVTIGGRQVQERREFHCPCHGSRYYSDGTNYSGPAPTPLAWHKLEIAPDDGSLIVDLSTKVGRDFRLTV